MNVLKNNINSKLTSAEKRRLSIGEALQQKLKIHVSLCGLDKCLVLWFWFTFILRQSRLLLILQL